MPRRENLELNTEDRDSLVTFFQNKTLYNSIFSQSDKKGLFFPIESNIFYGKVDTNNNLIMLNQDYLSEIQEKNNIVILLDIVAKAFLDMKEYFYKARQLLSTESVFYDLNAKSGYMPVYYFYNEYLNNFYKSFLEFIDHKYDKKIKNPLDFFDVFIEICGYFIKSQEMPLTKTGFLGSVYCSPVVSGLVINFGLEEDSDQIKYDKYIKDPNFDFYLETARKFNFLVDKEKPWRLVFNLSQDDSFLNKNLDGDYGLLNDNTIKDCLPCPDNPQEDCGKPLRDKGYLKMFGINSLEDFFNKRYYKSMIGVDYKETSELETLKIVFTQMYNTFVLSNEEFLQGKDIGKTDVLVSKNIRNPLYLDDLKKLFSEELWLKTLLYFRALETKQSWNQTEFDNIKKKSLILYKNYGIRNSINYINYMTRNILDVDKTQNRMISREDAINLANQEQEIFRF